MQMGADQAWAEARDAVAAAEAAEDKAAASTAEAAAATAAASTTKSTIRFMEGRDNRKNRWSWRCVACGFWAGLVFFSRATFKRCLVPCSVVVG